jgi:hypothetical protein
MLMASKVIYIKAVLLRFPKSFVEYKSLFERNHLQAVNWSVLSK